MGLFKLRIFLMVLIVLLIASFWGIRKYCQLRRRTATLNTIHAIQTAILVELRKDNHGLKEVGVPGDGHWYVLRSTSYDSLVTKLGKHHDIGATANWQVSRPLLDPWGNRFRIMLYHNPGKTWGISILSNGPDGIEQTADDLGRSSNYPYPGVLIGDPNVGGPDFTPGFDRYRIVESNSPHTP